MKSNMYLYGCNTSELPSIEEGAKARIAKAKELLAKLVEIPLASRDFVRIRDVSKAIDFYETLLNEERIEND